MELGDTVAHIDGPLVLIYDNKQAGEHRVDKATVERRLDRLTFLGEALELL